MLRRASIWFAALALVLACRGKLFTFPVEGEDSTVIEQGTVLEGLVTDLGFGDLVSMEVQISEELANQGAEPGDVDGVTFELLALEATEGGDLSFLDRLEFRVSGEGLPEVLVASSASFPPGQLRVELDLEDVDLTAYVVAESMDLVTVAEGRRPAQDTTVLASYRIKVGATLQGACNESKRRRDDS